MGCCSLRPSRPSYVGGNRENNEKSKGHFPSNKKNEEYNDPINLVSLDDYEEYSEEKQVDNKKLEKELNSLSPLKKNLETYNSMESRGRISNKDILKRQENSENKNLGYTPNRNSKRNIELQENLNNRNELI